MKKFPCPICKGKGGWKEIIIYETGEGPYEECNYCEGKGMLEINGELHKKIKAEKLYLNP